MPRQPLLTTGRIGPLDVAAIKATIDPFAGLQRFEVPKIVAEFVQKNCSLYDQRCFRKATEEFAKAKSSLVRKDLPQPIDSDSAYIERTGISLAAHLRNARTFVKFSEQAGELAGPILKYYSARLVASFLTDLLLNWNSPSPKHGVSLALLEDKDISADPLEMCFELRIHQTGTFQRLVDLLTLLGSSSAFSSVLMHFELKNGNLYERSPYDVGITDFAAIYLQPNPASTSYVNRPTFTLAELFNCDRTEMCKPIRDHFAQHHVLSSGNSEWITEQLLVYLSLFAASSLARYHPFAWNAVVAGVKTGIYADLKRDLTSLHNLVELIQRFTSHILFYAEQ